MFDIGFFELSLIGVVALVVIGPDRLPGVARTAGKWLGRMNRFVANIKEDIGKEIKDEDLKDILNQQKQLADEFKSVAEKAQSSINSINPSESIEDLLEINENDSNHQPDQALLDSIAQAEQKAEKKKKKKKKKKAKEEQREQQKEEAPIETEE